jgi:hypothetical protein
MLATLGLRRSGAGGFGSAIPIAGASLGLLATGLFRLPI